MVENEEKPNITDRKISHSVSLPISDVDWLQQKDISLTPIVQEVVKAIREKNQKIKVWEIFEESYERSTKSADEK